MKTRYKKTQILNNICSYIKDVVFDWPVKTSFKTQNVKKNFSNLGNLSKDHTKTFCDFPLINYYQTLKLNQEVKPNIFSNHKLFFIYLLFLISTYFLVHKIFKNKKEYSKNNIKEDSDFLQKNLFYIVVGNGSLLALLLWLWWYYGISIFDIYKMFINAINDLHKMLIKIIKNLLNISYIDDQINILFNSGKENKKLLDLLLENIKSLTLFLPTKFEDLKKKLSTGFDLKLASIYEYIDTELKNIYEYIEAEFKHTLEYFNNELLRTDESITASIAKAMSDFDKESNKKFAILSKELFSLLVEKIQIFTTKFDKKLKYHLSVSKLFKKYQDLSDKYDLIIEILKKNNIN